MKCPHCDEKITIPDCVIRNIDAYDTTPFIAAPCCKKGIYINATRKYHVRPAYRAAAEDNWGDQTVSSVIDNERVSP